ncbi:Bug family tripartite tricarboxylate transporter substrate binding protein [Neoroseomonas oryzicola]|uniref:Tripartite tricarboxylate transporter substrate binding protein n=1 Tax=Neoroseomonas oryzicola TaxID=535904 RepID=A0A9X9WED7_9PROT|nr:tripartite tricarboxylate transporter substrate binding protein [Neoroseomonas oryzicola]MBR0658697.1 tripartite tricarboxylate transporter substrate binding protein [Neoroseomonas oryzicola]NKE17867.1 tripartite tricarboxylate transporter substrate binding protein [Neoroseomonas oryzicola]
MTKRALLIGLLLLAGIVPDARAQAWPDRALRLLVPFAPGGVTDSVGRLSAEYLSARLGQPVAVENRTGAGGAIAVEAVARSRPDGYTLLTASASQMVMLPALARVSYDASSDLALISIIASHPQVLAISSRLGVTDLQGFIAHVRANPGAVNYASGGNGSSNHLAMALLLQRAGVSAVHVPYRGGAPAMQALLAGDVAAYFGNPSDIIPHQGGAAIRVVAIAGGDRLASLPGVPTVEEQGFPGFRAETWNGIVAPAGVPDETITRMAGILAGACADPAFAGALERLGTAPVCSSPAAFRATMERDGPLWRDLVRSAGLTLD